MTERSGVYRFLAKNWISIVGLLTGVVGIGLSIHFYNVSIAERQPVLIVDPVRTTIVDAESISTSTLKVLRENGSPVNGGVSSLRFYFWNSGKLPIKKENLLQQFLRLKLSDPDSEILNYKLLRISRDDIVMPVISEDKEDSKKSLDLTFNILEENDGFTGQIIYSGDPNADLNLTGSIEGVKKTKTNSTLSDSQFWPEFVKWFGFVIGMLIATAGIVTLMRRAFDYIDEVNKRGMNTPIVSKFKYFGSLAFIGCLTVFVIVSLLALSIFGPFVRAREDSHKNITTSVPAEIKP